MNRLHQTVSQTEIRSLEEAALNGLPALRTQHFDGWLLRFSAGYSRRANSVVPLYRSTRSLGEKISYCESEYARAALPCIFKLSPASAPEDLDEQLSDMGYERDAETLVQTVSLNSHVRQPDEVDIYDSPDGPWLEAWRQLSPRTEQSDILAKLLRAVPAPAAYAVVQRGGAYLGCGRAVLSGGTVGLFDLLVAENHRRQGIGFQLAQARLSWARERGAELAYLQVMGGNVNARRLQERFGFREAYRYWYRVKNHD